MQEISNIELVKLGVLTGCIFLILVLPIKFYLRIKVIKKIKNLLNENEVIVYKPKVSFILDYFVTWCVGGFIGAFILPFLIHPEINIIRIVTRDNLILFILVGIISILAILIIYSLGIVLTNLRILYLSAFNIGKIIDIRYSDIKLIKLKKNFVDEDFYIETKQDKFIHLLFLSNKQKVKEKIEMLLKYTD